MSRVANEPVIVPSSVTINIMDATIKIKGNKGELSYCVHPLVNVSHEDNSLKVVAKGNSKKARALSGTTRALIQNIVTGVSEGYETRLEVVGVGYRVAVSGKTLTLNVGYSNPVIFQIPEGIEIVTPSQTEISVKGFDKQQVGQVAANIRACCPPEPYKGKGIRYANEHIVRKEAKKS